MKTARVLNVTDKIITVGTESGSTEQITINRDSIIPHVGDILELYSGENGNYFVIQSSTNSISANKKCVNKVAYCLLAIFLGGIGIHRFYAGKIGHGILHIIFCWTFIPTIISVIQFFIALGKTSVDGNIYI